MYQKCTAVTNHHAKHLKGCRKAWEFEGCLRKRFWEASRQKCLDWLFAMVLDSVARVYRVRNFRERA